VLTPLAFSWAWPPAASFQTITAAFSALTAIVGFGLLFRKSPVALWFRSQPQLIADRTDALHRLEEMTTHAREARLSVSDLRGALEARGVTIESLERRMDELEARRPIYDAALAWTPRAVEYVAWVELAAKSKGVDLGGRQMPPLPPILVDYFDGKTP